MLSRRTFLKTSAAASASLSFSGAGFAQEAAYPTREIHSLCGFPAGTTADIWVRYFSDQLSKLCGKPVIVDNKPGANGLLATEQAVRSKPDGYTIFIAPGSSLLAAGRYIYSNLSFDPINDFDHITPAVKLASTLCVAVDSPAKNVPDLVAILKKEKGFYGTSTNTALVASALFLRQFDLDATQVPYRTTPEALNDIKSGKLTFMFVDSATAMGLERGGHLRSICTSSQERMEATPDVPSAKEAGLTMDLLTWWSVHAPKGLPKPIFDKLETMFNQITRSEGTREYLMRQGASPFIGDSKSLKELLVHDEKAWGQYVKLANIQKM